MVRRGQFFIIGSVIVAAMVIGAILAGVASINTPTTFVPRNVFDHALETYPQAINLAVTENASPRHIQRRGTTFLAVQQNMLHSHGLGVAAHGIVSIPDGDNVSVIVFNQRGQAIRRVTVRVDGVAQRVDRIPDRDSSIVSFTGVTTPYNVSVSFTGENSFTHQYVGGSAMRAVYHLRVDGEDQIWQGTRTY